MTIPQFISGARLDAEQLNAMLDRLDIFEPTADVPAPLFQRREISEDLAGTEDRQARSWNYLILHKEYNNKLYYRYSISEADEENNPSIVLHVADIQPGYVLTTPNGTNTIDGFINLDDRITKGTGGPVLAAGVQIPGGMAYVVRFELDRDDATYLRLHWLYEVQ